MENKTKKCSIKKGCGIEKSLDCFSLDKKGKFGRTNICKDCKKIYDKKYNEKHKDKKIKQSEEYTKNNKEKIFHTFPPF